MTYFTYSCAIRQIYKGWLITSQDTIIIDKVVGTLRRFYRDIRHDDPVEFAICLDHSQMCKTAWQIKRF